MVCTDLFMFAHFPSVVWRGAEANPYGKQVTAPNEFIKSPSRRNSFFIYLFQNFQFYFMCIICSSAMSRNASASSLLLAGLDIDTSRPVNVYTDEKL